MRNRMFETSRFRSLFVRFARDEEGGIIILTLILLTVMLVVGGMAVDFMRFESQRAQLQSVADRAVLAAADLEQTVDPVEVVNDFFLKAGYADSMIGQPKLGGSGATRRVSVDSQVDVNTFYLRLIGIDDLSEIADSTAIEGAGNVEISLILDVSWSMNSYVASEGKKRIDLLEEAAVDFVEALLREDNKDEISINLVPYSQQVNLGPELFGALNTTPSVLIDEATGEMSTTENYCVDLDPVLLPEESAELAQAIAQAKEEDDDDDDALVRLLLPGDFGKLSFDTGKTYRQVEDARLYNGFDPVCPPDTAHQVIALSQNADALTEAIRNLEPSTDTSIHLGMQWGVSLLDPSMRGLLSGLKSTDESFAGNRPADYDDPDTNTLKYVILMTDGQNRSGPRVRPEYYDTAEERNDIAYYGLPNYARLLGVPASTVQYTPHPTEWQDMWLQATCARAREKMQVYTIAMGATQAGIDEMAQCASGPDYAFKTNFSKVDGDKGIDEIFADIARQITALRLSN